MSWEQMHGLWNFEVVSRRFCRIFHSQAWYWSLGKEECLCAVMKPVWGRQTLQMAGKDANAGRPTWSLASRKRDRCFLKRRILEQVACSPIQAGFFSCISGSYILATTMLFPLYPKKETEQIANNHKDFNNSTFHLKYFFKFSRCFHVF